MASSYGGASAPPNGGNEPPSIWESLFSLFAHMVWVILRTAASLWAISLPILAFGVLYLDRRHLAIWQLSLLSLLPVIWLVVAWRTGHLTGNWRAHVLRRRVAALASSVDAKALPPHRVLTRRGKVIGVEMTGHIGWSHDQLIAAVDDILAAYRLPADEERSVESHALGHITVRLVAPVSIPDSFEADAEQLHVWATNSDALTLGYGVAGLIVWQPVKVPHLLVVGVTGSGKSVLGYSLTAQAMLAGYQIVAIDPKQLDLAWLRKYKVQTAVTPEAAGKALEFVRDEMQRRLGACADANVTHVHDLPSPPTPVLVTVDEAAELLDAGNKPAKDAPGMSEWLARTECLDLVRTIARLGRAADIHLLLLAQRPDASILSGQLRSQLSARVVVQDAGGPEAMRMVGLEGEAADAFRAASPRPGRFSATFGAEWTIGQAPLVSMETLGSLQ